MKCMNNVKHSQSFLRKRKMMVVLPLLIIPFITMTFWAMGGGKAAGTDKKQIQEEGLNFQLPDANLKDDRGSDKMSFYDQADKDSIKLAELVRNDPYYRSQDSMKKVYLDQLNEIEQIPGNGINPSPYNSKKDPAEEKVMKKLAQLNEAMNQPQNKTNQDYTEKSKENPGEFNSSVDRLENMMQAMNSGNGDDPEMKQLNNALEKILDVQHPERVKEQIKQLSLKNKTRVYAVSNAKSIAVNSNFLQSRIDTTRKKFHNAFYELNSKENVEEQDNSVSAVIHETQTVVAGATVKLRLLDEMYVAGPLVPKNSFVYGTASPEDERLLIKIETVRYKNNLLPVKLSVYDMDGLAGIHIPGSISRDVARESADQSIQSMELGSLDPSLKLQAANAGIHMAKSLLTKKTKLVKVTVKAGYQVLLRDENKQDN